jgi:lipopolysaccharide/colanic/teichoic acid biosynthesis glycosyltransferase
MARVENLRPYNSLPQRVDSASVVLWAQSWPMACIRVLDAAILVLAAPVILAAMVMTQISSRGAAAWHRFWAVGRLEMSASWYAAAKRPVDVILSALLLVLAAPLLLIVMALVKVTSRGPALYFQVRTGLNGRTFIIYKVRSMVHNYESQSGPRWAGTHDPGITPIGRFLRRTHIDEVPQLYNVLRGDMSLVGPRPERPEIIARLELAIPRYRERLAVRPGLTGLAQVYLPPDTILADVNRKLSYDLFYIRQAGIWMDVRILLSTACFLLGIPFRISTRLLGIPGPATVREFDPSLLPEAEPASQMQPA